MIWHTTDAEGATDTDAEEHTIAGVIDGILNQSIR